MITIVILFVLLIGLLLWFIIGARGKWYLKLVMIVAIPAFMIAVWSSLSSFSGWPLRGAPAAQAAYYYVYGFTVEPNPQTGDRGAVYIWMIPQSLRHGVLEYAPKKGEPRAFTLPYSRKLEDEVNAANASSAKGGQVIVKKIATKSGKNGQKGSRRDPSQLHFYNFIFPNLPPKGPFNG